MHRSEIDGVPVFWRQGPEPLSAALVFRVGGRDETFVRSGITHLVEHLVMATLGKRHLEHNASVGIGDTCFEASGRPSAVAGFLADVCRALSDLPVHRLRTEQKVLVAEGRSADHPVAGEHLLVRYGLRGLGLAGSPEPALDQIDADDILHWVRRHFVAANAALCLTGPPPDGLRLELPQGPRPVRPASVPIPRRYPLWSTQEYPGFGLSFLLEHTEAARAGLRIALDAALDELRHARGLIYHLDYTAGPVAPGEVFACFYGDPEGRATQEVWQGVDAVLRRLGTEGPSPAELKHDLEGTHEHFADPRAVEGTVLAAVLSFLGGEDIETPEQVVAEREAVTPDDVRRAFSRYPDTLLLSLPEDCPGDLPAFPAVPERSADALPGRVFKRRLLSPVPRGSALVLGDEGMCAALPDGPLTVRWNEVVGLAVDPDGVRTVVGADDTCIPFHPRWFSDGETALRILDTKVPAEFRFVDKEPG